MTTSKNEMRDLNEIARCVRADIKAAIAAKTLPAFKVSVRQDRGGRSLRVTVTGVPAGYLIPNLHHVMFSAKNPHTHPAFDADVRVRNRDCDRAIADIKVLESIVREYNWDKSDTQSDYFHVNFYQTVEFDWELRSKQANELRASLDSQDFCKVVAATPKAA